MESGALWRCGIVMTLGLCVFVCLRARPLAFLYFLITQSFTFLRLYVKSGKCVALRGGPSSFNMRVQYITLAVMLRAITREELFFCFLKSKMCFFPQDRKTLITPHAPLTLVMGRCKDTNGRKQEKHKRGKRVW